MQYSIVNLSEVKNNDFRFDSEYFSPDIIRYENNLKKNGFIKFGEIIEILTDYTSNGSFANLNNNVNVSDIKSYAKWVRIQNLDNNEYNINIRYVDENGYNFLKKTKLLGNEILISKTGEYLGKSYIFKPKDNDYYTLADNIFLIKLKNNNISYFIYAWINSNIGRRLLLRYSQGTGQPTIIKNSLRSFPIPIMSNNFQEKIAEIVDKAFELQQSSTALYKQAEEILLSELGLLDWKPKHQLYYIKNFSDTTKAERFDAEYFQPVYEDIIEKIKTYNNGFNFLQNIVKIKDKNFTPKEEKGYRYIELSNISNNGEIKDFTTSNGLNLPTRARREVGEGDLILSSIEGSLNSIALITENYNNMLCSTGFFVVNSKEINMETLLIFFKSIIGQLQLKKGCSGTILTAISKEELNKILIPKINQNIQNIIKYKIKNMYYNKQQSKHLLEVAKRAVEVAIEENEDIAMNFIKDNINISKESN